MNRERRRDQLVAYLPSVAPESLVHAIASDVMALFACRHHSYRVRACMQRRAMEKCKGLLFDNGLQDVHARFESGAAR